MFRTIPVKTLVLLMLLILSIGVIVFGALYTGVRPERETGGSPAIVNPPNFLFSIYEGKHKLNHPIFMAVDKKGKIHISNNNIHTIEVVSPNGRPVIFIGGSGQSEGRLHYPYGIGILPDGNILVAETGNFRIQEFSADGKFVKTFIGQPNKIGLSKPGPLFVDSHGRVYVGDLSGHQVFILDRTGKVLRKIAGVQYPHGIAVDEKRQKLYIGEAGQTSIKVYSLADKNIDIPLKTIDTWGPGLRFSMIRGLAVDRHGRLYVADTVSSSVRVFDENGKYLFSFGGQGYEDGQFLYPNGIHIDKDGKIYVADWGNNRISIWTY